MRQEGLNSPRNKYFSLHVSQLAFLRTYVSRGPTHEGREARVSQTSTVASAFSEDGRKPPQLDVCGPHAKYFWPPPSF